MPQRSHHWSNGVFASWTLRTFARGTAPKPTAATLKEWKEWKNSAKHAAPFIYWFLEEFLDGLQNFINYPYDKLCDARYYLYNRFIDRTHYLMTGLKPGRWYDLDRRLLHGVFTELVDFVEIEKAWLNVIWDKDAQNKFHTPWWRKGARLLRWKPWRCPEAGIEHLKWEMTLKNDYECLPEDERQKQPDYNTPSQQALDAKEIYELYMWWKTIRPSRSDPSDSSGWSDYCEKRHEDMEWLFEAQSEEEKIESRLILDKLTAIEKAYAQEDEAMMIRLIKLRHSLWT
jgi:hypothetical protein